jgi:hypothetical protein
MYERSQMNKEKMKKENNSSISQSVLGPSGALSQSNFHKRINNYKTGQQSITMRRFGTEITNTSSSSSVLHHEAVKKTNGLKNKFLDKPVPKTKREESLTNCNKIAPMTQQNWTKNLAKEEPEDIDMEDTQELEEEKVEEDLQDHEERQLQETKEIRAQRRKTILKELEV